MDRNLTRRTFLASTTAAAAMGSATRGQSVGETSSIRASGRPVVISSANGLPATEKAALPERNYR